MQATGLNLETAIETAEYAKYAERERLLTQNRITCSVSAMQPPIPSLSVYSTYSAV